MTVRQLASVDNWQIRKVKSIIRVNKYKPKSYLELSDCADEHLQTIQRRDTGLEVVLRVIKLLDVRTDLLHHLLRLRGLQFDVTDLGKQVVDGALCLENILQAIMCCLEWLLKLSGVDRSSFSYLGCLFSDHTLCLDGFRYFLSRNDNGGCKLNYSAFSLKTRKPNLHRQAWKSERQYPR